MSRDPARELCRKLRRAAIAGDWAEHDRLAAAPEHRRLATPGPGAGRVLVVLAEHALQRGAYARALDLLRGLDPVESEVRLAALVTRLHALLSCAGHLAGDSPLAAEIAQTAGRLAPLLQGGEPAEPEDRVRFRRGARLLHQAGALALDGAVGEPAVGPATDLATGDPLADGWEIPAAALELRLQWVRETLARAGSTAATICDDVLSSLLIEAQARGLTVIEMFAHDLRAMVRADHLGRWDAALADAGAAANLAARLIALNAGTRVERPLRSTLLPQFDRALEVLARAALATPDEPRSGERDRVGRALLDYVEQMAELALAEATRKIRSAPAAAIGVPVIDRLTSPGTTEDLQAPLRRGEGVLQYFLVGRYLLVFAYGRDFLSWDIQAPKLGDAAKREPLPVRALLTPLLATWRARQMARRRTVGLRDLVSPGLASDDEHRQIGGLSLVECVQRITAAVLPAPIAKILERSRTRRLAIVPHDILYRVPFGSLPWRRGRLCDRFSLSLQPTGALAGHRPAPSRPPTRPRCGFFLGPGLSHSGAERQALREALDDRAEVVAVDTEAASKAAFTREAPGCDVLYLACHGHAATEAGASGARTDQETLLQLGARGSVVGLAEIAALDLDRCQLAVLQSCWTGWMSHLREAPVQGFPHALRDAGARTVVAPMFPVDDPLCPVFAAVFGRELRIRAVGDALAASLRVLRRHGDAVLSASAATACFAGASSIFDGYEYRLTGDPGTRLHGGWASRLAARIELAAWLAHRIAGRMRRRLDFVRQASPRAPGQAPDSRR